MCWAIYSHQTNFITQQYDILYKYISYFDKERKCYFEKLYLKLIFMFLFRFVYQIVVQDDECLDCLTLLFAINYNYYDIQIC